jgi:hypothetical protein
VWNKLHHIEEQIYEHLDTLANVEDHARLHAPEKDSQDKLDRADPSDKRKVAISLVRESHKASEVKYQSQRTHQRGALVSSAVLFLLVGVLLGLQVLVPEPFVPPPPSMTSVVNPPVLLLLVMLVGAAGGALSGLITLYGINKDIPDTLWFDPRPALLAVKIVTGMWTAFIGVVIVGTETVVGLYTSLASLLLLALSFGYTQQAVTVFLDRKTARILGDPQ